MSTDVNKPAVNIPGNLFPVMKTIDQISRYGYATLPTCATATRLSYNWAVVRTSDSTLYASISSNPRLLVISSNTLAPGYAGNEGLSSSSSAISIFVQSGCGSVVAVISG
jgi:hypothetical protein